MTTYSQCDHYTPATQSVIASIRAALRARRQARQARRCVLLAEQEILSLSDHILQDIGYFRD